MKKYIEDEIFRGILIVLLGFDVIAVVLLDIGYIYMSATRERLSLMVFLGMGIFALIMRSAGHYRGREEITVNYFDGIPLEIYAVGDFALIRAGLSFFAAFNRGAFWSVAVAGLGAAYLGAIFGCMSIAVRCKTHAVIKNTLVYKSFSAVGRFFKNIKDSIAFYILNLPLYWQIALAMGVVCICMAMGFTAGIIALAVVTVWLAKMAVAYKNLEEGIEKIAGGETGYQIPTENMPAYMAQTANHLNNINNVVSDAVSKRIKSEQFKTELITNVSHDIKTPLTSIINYIDLIQKENITAQPLADYVNVLQRQSNRLKKLIDDLVEASKASTGNISVHLATTGLGLLLNQAAGEYIEKAENRGLEMLMQLPENEIYILSDGRLLWRVFDNLLNNACKYSQPGTRVYITLERKNDKAVISFKNISKVQLNISPNELMERFVRGDSSRNTEGSGLGLSIAQSLTEILGGTMSLGIDGDLFKAELIFDTV